MKTAEQLQKELDDLKDHNAHLAQELAKALQAYADEYQRRKKLEKAFCVHSQKYPKPLDQWKAVSKEEFFNFVRNYPMPLTRDFCAISEPPLVSYNDYSDGKKWPESMVAKHKDHAIGEKEFFIRQ